jgi:PD-(D/E)XK nuclease superfamily
MLRRAGTDKTDEEMIHEQLSGKIIGAAMDVLNELRPGLDEKLYKRAMIFMPEPDPCYPLIRGSFETLKIVAWLAPKDAKH